MSLLSVEPIEETTTGQESLLDAIRADYAAAASAPQTLDLPIPKSRLGVRYRALSPDELPEVDEDAQSMHNADILIAACECVIVKGEHGWEPFAPDGYPLRLSVDLARALGQPGDTAREATLAAFSTMPAPTLGISRHVVTYYEWMAGERMTREEAELGKS